MTFLGRTLEFVHSDCGDFVLCKATAAIWFGWISARSTIV
jgi:hypothetical protein